MKYVTCFIPMFVLTATSSLYTTANEFSVVLEPKWENLEPNAKKTKEFGGKWMLVGSITFKKNSKEPVNLSKIYLNWQGKTIKNLVGSLYKKKSDKNFMPIQDYLICDSAWNQTKQTLILKFDEKQILGPTTIFYLVLTIPENIEKVVKKGSFVIEKEYLPEQFKVYALQHNLPLALYTNPQTVST